MPYVTWQDTSGAKLGGSVREDLQDWVANLAAKETPLLTGLPQVKVKSTFVEFLTDTFRDAAANAVVEAFGATHYDCSLPQRSYTHVQTFYNSGAVSDIEREVAHAGYDDPYTYLKAKSLIELKKDMEHALHRGSCVSGATSSARQFNGLLNALSTNMTSSSGTTLTEGVYGNILELIYQSGSAKPEEVYLNSRLKRTVSNYSTKNTFNLPAADRRQVLATDFYESDFGVQRMYLSRDQLRSAAVGAYGNSFVAIDPRYFATGWLQTVRSEDLSRAGLYDRFQISASMTLIVKNELAGGGMTNVVANIP